MIGFHSRKWPFSSENGLKSVNQSNKSLEADSDHQQIRAKLSTTLLPFDEISGHFRDDLFCTEPRCG
jgi:hypothetical protein